MHYKQTVKGRIFAANNESEGIYELIAGSYLQHRGNSQTPKFRDGIHFRRYVLAMLRTNNL